MAQSLGQQELQRKDKLSEAVPRQEVAIIKKRHTSLAVQNKKISHVKSKSVSEYLIQCL